MDKNSIIGLLLIGAIVIGYSIYMAPTEAEKAEYQRKKDSIANVYEQQAKLAEQNKATIESLDASGDAAGIALQNDSVLQLQQQSKYGVFANAANGEDNYLTLENEYIKATVAQKGGRLVAVELKDYKTYKQTPLLLFDEDSSRFNLNFYADNKFISTDELYFTPNNQSFSISGDEKKSLSMRMYAEDKNKYVEFIYTLTGNSYLVDFDVKFVGLENLIAENGSEIGLNWGVKGLNNEKNIDTERNTSSIFYKYIDEDVDWLSETSDDEENFEAKMHWLSFKQQYFSAAIISQNGFVKRNSDMSVKTCTGTKYTREFETNLMLPIERGASNSETIQFYFGPNHYQTLDDLGIDMEDQINLGPVIIQQVNEYVVIGLFNLLDSQGINYGIIILILTIVIKMALFPITYKTYLSSAKMKVLKPEIEEINEKHKDGDAMAKQQATMALYRKAGVNPMAGCIPQLIQLPILYAMFRFFPSSIELRQEGFLWADDLSTYDSIFDFGFNIPFYGDHVSLFTLLMAISMFAYTKTNAQMSSMGGGMQAQQMKMMTYMMPVMMLFFFNSYSAGLSYYYFLANCVSMGQQFVIKKWFIDEDEIHRKIQENKKKPVKKSKFQKRMEDLAKQQQLKGKR